MKPILSDDFIPLLMILGVMGLLASAAILTAADLAGKSERHGREMLVMAEREKESVAFLLNIGRADLLKVDSARVSHVR